MTFNKVYIIFFSFLIIFFSIKLFVKLLQYLKIYDLNQLANGKYIVSSTGVMLSPFVIVICLLIYFNYPYEISKAYIVIPFTFVFLNILCFIDDIKSTSVVLRLAAYFSFCFLSLSTINFEILYITSYEKVNIFLYLVLWVFFINCANFMDGGDNYYVNLFIPHFLFFCFFFYFITSNDLVFYFNFIILSFLICFKFLNKFPAKVYLGDSGSISIGYFCFFNILKIIENGYFFIGILLILTVILDPGLTIMIRVLKNKNIFSRHQGFFIHMAKQIGYSVNQVSNKILQITLLNIVFCIILLYSNHLNFKIFVLGLFFNLLHLLSLVKYDLKFFVKNQK